MPVTVPAVLIVAADVLLLLQTPPPAALVSVVFAPVQTVFDPAMVPVAGKALMVATFVAAAEPHTLLTVYDITEVPAATPDTTPPELTVATVLLALLHTPPVVVLLSVAEEPAHIKALPDMVPATGNALTVTVFDADPLQDELVTTTV